MRADQFRVKTRCPPVYRYEAPSASSKHANEVSCPISQKHDLIDRHSAFGPSASLRALEPGLAAEYLWTPPARLPGPRLRNPRKCDRHAIAENTRERLQDLRDLEVAPHPCGRPGIDSVHLPVNTPCGKSKNPMRALGLAAVSASATPGGIIGWRSGYASDAPHPAERTVGRYASWSTPPMSPSRYSRPLRETQQSSRSPSRSCARADSWEIRRRRAS